MLDQNGHAKLTDFDLVGAHDTTGGTRTGALGTLVYAAPECLERPQDATPRADVYGLGMTMIFCLSGRELSLPTFRNSRPTIARLDCPSEVRKVIQKAAAWELRDRLADVATMTIELRNALRLPDQARVAADKQRQTELRKILIDSGVPAYVNMDELLKIPSQYRLGRRLQRWFTCIVSWLIVALLAAGVTFMIIRLTREATPTTSSVHVVSVPTGADVTFDGTLLTNRTPVTIEVAPVGTKRNRVA